MCMSLFIVIVKAECRSTQTLYPQRVLTPLSVFNHRPWFCYEISVTLRGLIKYMFFCLMYVITFKFIIAGKLSYWSILLSHCWMSATTIK